MQSVYICTIKIGNNCIYLLILLFVVNQDYILLVISKKVCYEDFDWLVES